MERNEMVKLLMEKTKVTKEEAIEALENSKWDLLDAIVYLERKGKVENNQVTTIIEVESKSEENKEESFGGIGEIIGRVFKFAGKVLKKANEHYFEVRKDGEKPIRMPLTISAVLLIFLFVPTIVLLAAGLFFGYKYSIAGKTVNYNGVNNIFDGISKSAESMKKEFKEGYGK